MRPTHFIGLRRDFKKIIKLIKKKVMTSSMKTDLKFSSQIQMHSVFLKSNHKKLDYLFSFTIFSIKLLKHVNKIRFVNFRLKNVKPITSRWNQKIWPIRIRLNLFLIRSTFIQIQKLKCINWASITYHSWKNSLYLFIRQRF